MARAKILILLSACFLSATLTLFGQTEEELSVLPAKVDEAPRVAPTECTAALVVETDAITGSASYVLLRKVIKVMKIGHRATEQQTASFSPTSATTIGAQVLHSNLQMSTAVNGYLCASFLTGRIKNTDAGNKDVEATEDTAIHTLITVFNRLAMEAVQLRSEMTSAAENAEKGQNAMSVSFADKLASILQDRKDVATDLDNVVSMTALLAVDISDQTAAKTDTLKMSSSERQDLLRQVTVLASSTRVDEFTRGAKRFQYFLSNHRKSKIR
ncbi:MAG TPA: hypothetical protein VGD64_11935 [Acidisarcina sp.]